MMINRHLERLSQKDPDSRQTALSEILLEEGLNFTLQEEDASMGNPRGIRNYLVSPWNSGPSFRFTTMLCPAAAEPMTTPLPCVFSSTWQKN